MLDKENETPTEYTQNSIGQTYQVNPIGSEKDLDQILPKFMHNVIEDFGINVGDEFEHYPEYTELFNYPEDGTGDLEITNDEEGTDYRTFDNSPNGYNLLIKDVKGLNNNLNDKQFSQEMKNSKPKRVYTMPPQKNVNFTLQNKNWTNNGKLIMTFRYISASTYKFT